MADRPEPLGPIRLARVAPFRLGSVEVHPATRQVERDGRSQTLEPRIMQVLVALAQADGEILSRDELVTRCWDGRIVGENAIHRAVSRVRDVGLSFDGAFRLETISKVGYRMIVSGAAEATGRAAAFPVRRRRWIAAVIAAGLAAVLVLAVFGRWPGNAPPTLAVVAQHSSVAPPLARDLGLDLARLASARAGDLSVVGAGTEADFVVRVAAQRVGDRLQANLSLVARNEPELLWSTALERPFREAVDLRQQLAAKVGQVLLCAIGARSLDRPTLRLYLAACDRDESRADDRRVALLRQVVQRAPGFAQGWAELALAEAELLAYGLGSEARETPQRQALYRAAREHVARARALDPSQGAAFAAEFTLVGRERSRDNLDILERGLGAAPDYAMLHSQRSFVLEMLGYMRNSVDGARRAVSLDPLSPRNRDRLISALAYSGRIEEARRELEEAERVWPNAESTREARSRFHLRYGDPTQALAMFDRGEQLNVDPESPHFGRPFLRARAEPSQANVDAVLEAGRRLFDRNPGSIVLHVQLLGHFERVEEAYRILEAPGAIDRLRFGAEVLFRPQMQSIRRDPRFMRLTARLGLLAHWQRTGRWPDFCGDPSLPYRCRDEAQRLLRISSA